MTTLSVFRQISGDLARWQGVTAKTPDVATATAVYAKAIGKVRSIDDFIGDTRVFRFAMEAFGLGDKVDAKALMRKVLTGGVSDPKALANTLNAPKIRAFAKAFDFAGGVAVGSSAATTTDVISAFVEQALEKKQGADNEGVRLALSFARAAPKIATVYDILADKSLLTVVQTALGISPMTSAQNIDRQAANLKKQVNVADFADAKKLGAFIARFAARYDAEKASASGSLSPPSGIGLSAETLLSLQKFRAR